MPRKTEYVKSRSTRAERIDKKLRAILEECVIIDYVNDRRSLTGRVLGDPTPEHLLARRIYENERKE